MSHAFGYSKTTRAKCHGPAPCNGTPLPVGTLRYGSKIVGEYGETVEWRHWGCVTPAILNQLASVNVNSLTGFQELSPEDQHKIILAISLRRVDPNDIPETAKPKGIATNATPCSSTQQKRKATTDIVARPVAATAAMPSSQEGAEENDDNYFEEGRDELYCVMGTNVVGIQYYKGLVGPGEEVHLVREPQNRYDSNAIQVKNIGGTQVGHLPRKVAERLAPLLDRRVVTVEGVINDGNLSGPKKYTLSITLKIYGGSDMRPTLEPLLVWATPGQRGFKQTTPAGQPSNAQSTSTRVGSSPLYSMPQETVSRANMTQIAVRTEVIRNQQETLQKAAELKEMLDSLEKVNDEDRRGSLMDALCSTEDVLNLPLYPNPPGVKTGELTVDLLRHQLQGLQWCVEREYPVLPKDERDKPIQFWQMRKNGTKPYYYNIATKTPQLEPPLLGRGALCADAMGLGKTLTMIALILATKKDIPRDFSNATLIVSPLSVLSNWEKQIEDHCTPGSLSTCVYYGANRNKSAAELQKYDIVITTYQTVSGEHAGFTDGTGMGKKKKKVEKNLFEVQWKRIILDEGHTIRNSKSKTAQAACGLNAQRRWILSGTPIINSPKDLGSIITFLRVCRPLDDEDFFKRLLFRPLKNGETAGVELLRVLMSHICIRRTKEMQDSNGVPLIALPPVEFIKVPVALNDEARQLYDEVEEVSKQKFELLMNRGTHTTVQSNVLSMLTRMRQLALHPGLVPANYLEQLRAAEESGTALTCNTPITHEEKERLQYLLTKAIEDYEECPICFGILDDARITKCAHIFCLACITEVISRDSKCPMDRRPITMNDLYEPSPDLTQNPIRMEEDDDLSGIRAGSSAKIEQLIRLLRLNPSDEKSLVFSQFTSFLDKIAEALEEQGISYVRFDGKMSAKKRQETIAQFSEEIPQSEGDVPSTAQAGKSSRPHSGLEQSFEMDIGQNVDNFDDSEHNQASKGKQKAKKSSFAGDNPRVMLISLKAGALGLNLTVANNVYLMDPWWQEGIESQAVDRVNRIGQKKPVHVYQLIAENTVESKVLEIQERKKKLVQQAFSGIKRKETPRQQREARLQDLVELFGASRQAAA